MRNIALFGVQADRGCILPLADSKQNSADENFADAPMLRWEGRV
jgi:hypothetical protein